MNYPRLWAACLALVPLAAVRPVSAQAPPPVPSPAAPVLIGLVTKISIVGLKNVPADAVQAKLTLKVGDAYTPEAAQKDVDALKSMGVFQAKISVSATQTKTVETKTVSAAQTSLSGIVLTYTVAENPVVQSIKFTANTPSGQPSVPAAELIAHMKTQVGQVLNTNILVKDLDILFNHDTTMSGYVAKQGYMMDVSTDINIDPKIGVVTIPLVEYYIKSIEVTGNSRVKTADILAQTHMKVGDVFNNSELLQDASTLYETGQVRTVSYNWNIVKPGAIALKLSLVEQPAATGSLDEKQGKVVPFLYDPPIVAYPVVQVSVNGHLPLPFLLDTGSSSAVSLSLEAAKELGIEISGKQETGNGFTVAPVSIKSAILQGQDKSNNVALDTKEADVLDLSLLDQIAPDSHIAGIVGLGALLQVTSRFDFVAKTLTIFSATHPPLHIPDATVLPLQGNPYGTVTVRATLALETYASLIIDTGSNSTQIPLPALSVLHPTAIAFTTYSQRIDGTFASPNVRLQSLMLGALRVPNVEVGTLPPPTRLSLGMDILADYRLTLDIPNGQLIMEPSIHSKRYPRGRSGLDTEPSGGGWKVSSLSSVSPARDAGLQIGDQLVAVAGTSVQGLSDAQLGELFAVRLGTSLQVRVRRAGKEIPLSWVPVDAFIPSPTAIDGLPMQKAPGSPWVISAVMQGCPNAKAGLQAGDTLTKIDGEATASMLLKRFAELVEKPAVLVEVERPGVAQPFIAWLTTPK